MTHRALITQMLEVLEYTTDHDHPHYDDQIAAITAAREYLAAPEQEPVAYASDVEFDDETEIIPAEQKGTLGTAGLRIPLYIDPPASKSWVGLTVEEFNEIWEWETTTEAAMRAIEAKLKEKNA